MIKAASISYAVFMAALTGLFCYGLVLVFSLNTNLEDHYHIQTALLQDRFSAVAYGQAEFQNFEPGLWAEGPGVQPGITHRFKRQAWGVLWNVQMQSIRQTDTLAQNYLMATQLDPKAPTLYLRDNDEPLKLSGVTTVEGLIQCSSRNVKRIRINSDAKMQITQNGPVERSKQRLPALELQEFNMETDLQTEMIPLEVKAHYQSFDGPMAIYEAKRLLENVELRGHILVESQDTLTVSATAKLSDVIIKAPKVIIAEDFKGSVQILAKKAIVLQDGVSLEYPSALVIATKDQADSSIRIGENCQLNGMVYMPEATGRTLQQHQITVGLNTQITGQMYCGGVLELYGDVAGQVITSSLLYQTRATKYSNLLKDIKLTRPEYPQWMFGVPNAMNPQPPVILKKV